jgi:serine/threonine-protein kinase
VEQGAETSVERIGRYEVLGELGTGGMAVVYRARDARLERDVAVKVLHPHLAKDAESRARFEREARAAARLRHPNIVEVYEFSAPDEPQSYMVTELIEGPTLRRFVERHPDVPAEVAALIGIVLCDALGAAHAQGVVHRDVKPDNLMLQRGQLKLTDFGIAFVADAHGMTITGQVLGSPAHMAPEQFEGAAVDARTDLFAAGTVLYLLAVGKLPFEGTTAHALLRRILEGEYTDAQRAAPGVGHRFAAIIRKTLERLPEFRYESAEALRAELCAFVREAGIEFPEQELRRYFEDPEGFVAALKARLKERLPQLGQEARRAGSIGDAMGYFNRALALDPGNAKIIALVRGVARRRQIERAARAAGIVGAAATVTAILSVTLFQSRVPPKPRAPVVSAEPVRDTAAPTVIVRATDSARSETPVVAAVDASVEAPPGAHPTRPLVRRAGEQTARGERLDAGAAQALGAMREVLLFPNPSGVVYSLNGGPPISWRSQSPRIGQFQVGQRIRFVVTASTGTHEPREWSDVIPPGDGPLRIPLRLRPVASAPDVDSTAAVHVPERFPLN